MRHGLKQHQLGAASPSIGLQPLALQWRAGGAAAGDMAGAAASAVRQASQPLMLGSCRPCRRYTASGLRQGSRRCCAVQPHLPLPAVDACAGQLPVVGVDAVSRHGCLHLHQGVGGHLVAQPSAAAVSHHAHLAHPQQRASAGRHTAVRFRQRSVMRRLEMQASHVWCGHCLTSITDARLLSCGRLVGFWSCFAMTRT